MKLFLLSCLAIFFPTIGESSFLDDIFGEYSRNFLGPSPLKEEIVDNDTFDFIIVGSGSAGAVLANRLSEIHKWRILLLEAGTPGNILTKIPFLGFIFSGTGYSWNYTTEKQAGICEGMLDNVCPWPKGKALGGSTVINYMIYTRANPEDHARWSKDNPGWSYEEVLPYYLKLEKCRLNHKICSNKYRNTNGKVSIEYPFSSDFTKAFLDGVKQLGLREVDINTPDYMGFSQIQGTLKRGRRDSVADAYLEPVFQRPNLKILTSCRVTKILIDPFTKQAYGVEFWRNHRKYIARAKKEVIVSAGTFHSPQLLMLSGIGPFDHLQQIGINPIMNLPVGQELYDHILFLGIAFKMNQTVIPIRGALLNPLEIQRYFFEGKGVLSSLSGAEAIGFIETSPAKTQYPDIELLLSGIATIPTDYGIISSRVSGYIPEVYEQTFKPLIDVPVWTPVPILLHPKSKGYLKLRSKNPFDPPMLYPNYFSDPEGHDMKTMIAGIRFAIKLSRTKALQKFGSTLHDIPLPGCENMEFNSDYYWECALRSIGQTVHHQIGTCKMGRREDPSAVVDNRCRVHGVKGLRVVDASVIPVTLSAHTNAPTIMIGEKISDAIKEEYDEL